MSKPIGAILAGGRSRRMGHDKALVHFRGLPLLDHVAHALNLAGLEAVVVGRDEPLAGYPTISDMPGLGGGPAVGLASAFLRYPNRDIFLAAVDQPLLRAETVLRMLEIPGDAVVPVANSHPQVTCALYREPCRLPLQAMLGSGQPKLRRLLDLIEPNMVGVETWSEWGEDGSSWLSLDTPEALRAAELRAAKRA
jgi:molybdopterin-guanine dinucleotide biosynthesis protein A